MNYGHIQMQQVKQILCSASFKPDMIAFVQSLAYDNNKEKHKQTASMHLLSLAIHMFGFLTHRACLASCCLAGIRESNWLVHVSKEKTLLSWATKDAGKRSKHNNCFNFLPGKVTQASTKAKGGARTWARRVLPPFHLQNLLIPSIRSSILATGAKQYKEISLSRQVLRQQILHFIRFINANIKLIYLLVINHI